MALKSIIDIEVDDTDFQRFASLYNKYAETLKESPDLWTKVSETASKSAEATNEMAAGVGGAFYALHKIAGENATITRNTERQASAWGTMATNAGKFASKIHDATRSLLRWAEISGLISGILGGGGLYGIDRLAVSASRQRRNSLGLGTTAGEANAFDTNYSRLFDTQQFLSGVNEALHDVTKRVGLYGAGLSERDIRGKDTAQVGNELIPYLKKIADQTPDDLLANVLQARHLDQFITLEDFQRLKHTPANEIAGYQQHYATDTNKMGITEGQLRIWQDLQVALERTGKTLQTDFIVRLTDLAPAIEHLSNSFLHLVEVVLNNPHMQQWIDDIAGAINRLATYLGGKDVSKDIDYVMGILNDVWEGTKHVIEDLPAIIAGFGKILDSIKNFINGGDAPWKGGIIEQPADPRSPQSGQFWNDHPELDHSDPVPEYPSQPTKSGDNGSWTSRMAEFLKTGHWPTGAAPEPTEFQKYTFNRLEKDNALPSGMLNEVMHVESHGDPNATSPAGAKGQFQFMDATAAKYGVTDPRDFTQSATGASHYFHDLLAEFHGDLSKALAGYNWGERHVEEAQKAYGSEWLKHAPAETQNYVGEILAHLGSGAQKQATDQSDRASLMTEFKGDLAKVAAAMKVGAPTVREDIAQYGSEWRAHLPVSVRHYLDREVPEQRKTSAKSQPATAAVAFNIYNHTGGNAFITASQLT